ncbi:hypothetical protein ACQPYH_44260 [Kribbella sp. CA-245084]|uniref:hypothetical protein n=1 Tax=Kribbella sp. CA-245084 TaxID=3239940 RepID=UPI003D8F908D
MKMSALAGLEAFQQANTKINDLAEYWSANQDLRRSMDAGLGAAPPLHSAQGPASGATAAPRRPASQPQAHREPPTSRGD